MRARSHDLLDAALDAGIGYVDVARSYGLAESFLASWLDGRDRTTTPLTVGSKWGYRYVGEWRMDAAVHEVKDHSLAMLRSQLAESRQLLGDWLRLYQIHSATFESGVLERVDVLRELARLRESGLAIGLTVSGPNQGDVLRAALSVRVDGVNPFQTVQATWNLMEPSAGPALAEAHDAGWGVIVKEALANGRLLRGEAGESLARIARRLGGGHDTERAAGPGGPGLGSGGPGPNSGPGAGPGSGDFGPGPGDPGPDAIALAAVLAQPWRHVVLSGAATVPELRANLRALDVQFEADDLRELEVLARPPEQYWAERTALPWA